MKKCNGCNKDIDKYAIACQYCGKLLERDEKEGADNNSESDSPREESGQEAERELNEGE